MSQHDIVLCSLNAKFIHSALGLRYLYANLGDLRERSVIREFTIHKRCEDIAETILADSPRIVGIGVYIWNIEESTRLVSMLKRIQPDLYIVVGGPEVSFEHDKQLICQLADVVICGQADHLFADCCRSYLTATAGASALSQASNKIIDAPPPDLSQLSLPYRFYSDKDIAQRILYVEASRGCPFKCEFCLSALDKTAYPFNLDAFLEEMRRLFDRGARHFKFVDRTFNLKVDSSRAILEFFLDLSQHADLFLHFELIPDNLPRALRESIARFKPGSLQFEIGIQTLDPTVQALISRKQNSEKVAANIAWLIQNSHAHLHTDLILGLPGQSIESIEHDFDTLIEWQVHEIQVGILKRLRGTPIIRHTEAFELRFNSSPPYNLLASSILGFSEMQRLTRFARYWDMIGNSGRFKTTLSLITARSPFSNFMRLSDALYQRCEQTHRIELKRLFELLHEIMIQELKLDADSVRHQLAMDFENGGFRKGIPDFMRQTHSRVKRERVTSARVSTASANRRQQQHIK